MNAVAVDGEKTPATPAPEFALSLRDNLLSAKVEAAPLWQVLEQLTRQTHVKVYFENLSSEEKVSAAFEKLPLEEGIKRLLADKTYTLGYEQAASTAVPKVNEIRIVSSRQGASKEELNELLAVLPAARSKTECAPADARSVEVLAEEALHARDAAKRLTALKALAGKDKQDPKVASTVATALADKDTEVRGGALDLVLLQNIAVPPEALEKMAFKDPSPELRFNALDGLVDGSDPDVAKGYLEKALKDPDPGVKDMAAQMLERVNEEIQSGG
jgi:hypothetical protein